MSAYVWELKNLKDLKEKDLKDLTDLKAGPLYHLDDKVESDQQDAPVPAMNVKETTLFTTYWSESTSSSR